MTPVHLEAVRAAIDQAHVLSARVAAHTLGPAGAAAMVSAGVDSIEHGMGRTESLIDEMAHRPTALVPTLEEGGPADLVVYPEDPRRDLGVLRAPSRIVLRGAPLTSARRDLNGAPVT